MSKKKRFDLYLATFEWVYLALIVQGILIWIFSPELTQLLEAEDSYELRIPVAVVAILVGLIRFLVGKR